MDIGYCLYYEYKVKIIILKIKIVKNNTSPILEITYHCLNGTWNGNHLIRWTITVVSPLTYRRSRHFDIESAEFDERATAQIIHISRAKVSIRFSCFLRLP